MTIWDGCIWSWQLRRPLYQWEKEEADSLLTLLGSIQICPHRTDSMISGFHENEHFSVKTLLDKGCEEFYDRTLSPELSSFTWNKRAPPRAQFTLWFLARGKLKCGNFLANIGLIPSGDSICPWCSNCEESLEHLFFTCFEAWKIWMELLNWWGFRLHYIATVMYLSNLGLIQSKGGSRLGCGNLFCLQLYGVCSTRGIR